MDMAAIRASIENTARALTELPHKARSRSAPLTARLVDGLRFEVRGGGGELVFTDMPAMMGGEGSAPNPGWLMRAALAACTATVIAMRASRRGVALSTLEVVAESDTDQRRLLGIDDSAASMTALRMKVRLGAEGVSEQE
ncbi:MAG: OsmC family protein, partial [Burkholderiales bacterium]